MSTPAPESVKLSDTAGSAPAPANSAAPEQLEQPAPPAPGATDAQWPSQCEDLTGITYRYPKGITQAWNRDRLARARAPRPKAPAGS